MPANLDQETDRLYGLPLEEFTAARNETAKRLENAGDAEDAERVKRFPKPSVPVWAINQLARKERMLVRSLLTSAERLRKAHESMLRGRSAERVREASDEEREVIRRLVRAAERILEESGHHPSATTRERIARTLRGAAVDEEGRELLKRGRLSAELDPTGLGPFIQGLPSPRGTAAKTTGARRKRDGDKEQRERLEAQARLRELRSAVRQAEKDVVRARGDLEKKEQALTEAQGALDAEPP